MTFPHTATIQKLVESAGKSTFTDTGTTLCFLQPLDAEVSQLYGVTYGKGFSCYLPRTVDVAEKMRLIIDGETYGVRGLQNRPYGNLGHKRAVLQLL